MNADVIYPKALLEKVFSSNYKTVLAVDIKACGKEEVKVIDGGQNKIVAIGKDLIEEQCLGEFIGVAKLSKDFVDISSPIVYGTSTTIHVLSLGAILELLFFGS